MMVRQRMQQAGKKSKKPAEEPLTVSCLLTCEWNLQGRSAEELLVESHAIEEKARAADLAGLKSEEKTPEEEELAEEMGDDNFTVMYGGGGDDEMKPGEPIFIFVGKISPEDRSQALAAAFAKARQEAEQLSKAAGAELGPLQSLSEGGGMVPGSQYYSYDDNPFSAIPGGDAGDRLPGARGEADPNEALGAEPGDVRLAVSVSAAFQLKGAK